MTSRLSPTTRYGFRSCNSSVGVGSDIQQSLLPAWRCQLVNSAFIIAIIGRTVGRTCSMRTQSLYMVGFMLVTCNSDNYLRCSVQIAPMLSGRIDIQYRRVQCTPPSNLVVNIDQNSGTGGFLKMSVSVSIASLFTTLVSLFSNNIVSSQLA